MKKKLIFTVITVVAMMCLLAISIGATPIYKDTTVTLNGTYTIGDGAVTNPVINLYDADGYALIWYLDTENKLVSDRAVNLVTVTNNKASFNDLSKFYGSSQQKGVVVVNLRDDFVEDGIKGIETFDSNFQFGYNGANDSTPIRCFYFPKTATEIIDRMFQDTAVEIVDVEPGTPIARLGIHALLNSNIKEFFIANDITAFVEADNVGVFQGTPIEKVVFEEGSQVKVITYSFFYLCKNLKEIVLPNSVEEIHERAFQLTMFDENASLEKLVFGANFKGFNGATSDNFYVRGSRNLKIYLPATFNAENVDVSKAHQTFTLCSNATFYYCGTEEAWDELIAKISLGKNGNVGTDSSENIVTAKSRGKVVFNYNPCEAFYGDNHDMEEQYVFEAFDKNTYKAGICERCDKEQVTENYGPIVVISGASYSDNDIMYNYSVNKTAIDAYIASGRTLSFGVVVALGDVTSPLNADGTLADGVGGYASNLTDRGNDLYEIAVKGIPAEHLATSIVCCGYITDGTTLHYMGATSLEKTSTPVTLEALIALTPAEIKEEY